MKVSLNQVKQYIDVDLPPLDELVELINQRLGGVEDIIHLDDKYKDAVIVKVVECTRHPDADRLSVTLVDDSGVVSEVERDENGLVQVVCGANNVYAGMYAIWLPPGAVVPETYDHAEPFVLSPKELRGVISNGMLASARELSLGDDHTGIIEVTEADVESQTEPANLDELVGKSFAKTFKLDDTIIDIENKMFTHRPDLFGQLGVAREISAILHPLPSESEPEDIHFINPDWYWQEPEFVNSDRLSLEVFNDAPDQASRFMTVVIGDVDVKPSPLWLRCALVAMGIAPVNSIVDLTNYLMLVTAQPVHAYDYDKIQGGTIGVRLARAGETIKALNGKLYELDGDDLVIADEKGPVGLAGVIGSQDSQVSEDTQTIILEVATFDMYAIRKTSMRHGLFTDAVTRFSKGQSHMQNDRVIAKLIDMIDGQQASQVYDLYPAKSHQAAGGSIYPTIHMQPSFVSQRLGRDFRLNFIGNILRRTNFSSYRADDDSGAMEITAPFWRTDIKLPEDIVEEVGRLYGFDNLPRQLPVRPINPAKLNMSRELKSSIRSSLVKSGANELLTYSFVNSKLVQAAGQDVERAYQISNALSPDLQYYRLSVLPSLLDKVHGNIKAGYSELALFEIGKSHDKAFGEDEAGLPVEKESLALVYADDNPKGGAAFYRAKRMVDQLLNDLKINVQYEPVDELPSESYAAPYYRGRSAYLVGDGGQALGMIGELDARVQKAFKLPEHTAAATIWIDQLLALSGGKFEASYRPLSRYPGSERDICFQVEKGVAYGQIIQATDQELSSHDYIYSLTPVDIYQPGADSVKNITIRINLTSYSHTLTSQEVTQVVDQVIERVSAATGARVV